MDKNLWATALDLLQAAVNIVQEDAADEHADWLDEARDLLGAVALTEPREETCPKCGIGKVTQVVAWSPFDEDVPHGMGYGLGFAGKDGVVCCSFNEGDYPTLKEARVSAAIRTAVYRRRGGF